MDAEGAAEVLGRAVPGDEGVARGGADALAEPVGGDRAGDPAGRPAGEEETEPGAGGEGVTEAGDLFVAAAAVGTGSAEEPYERGGAGGEAVEEPELEGERPSPRTR